MKFNKRIEIVSSTLPSLSSMGEISRNGAKTALEKHYTNVNITIVNSLADLEALVSRSPDLVFLGMTFLPMNPELGWQDPDKIWLSDHLEKHGIAYTGSDQTASSLERNKDHAKQRGIGFTLSYRRYCQLLKAKRCFYTGVELNKSPHKSPDHFTLDRIDSTGPYSDTNTVPCTGNFNIRKGNLTAEEVKLLYLAFRKKKLIV